MKNIKLNVPFCPPSVNSYWVRNRNGSVRVSERGKQFKENIKKFMLDYQIEKPFFISNNINVSLILNFKDKRKRDIDNYNKCLFDSFTGILWADDSQIGKLNIEIHRGTKKEDNFTIECTE